MALFDKRVKELARGASGSTVYVYLKQDGCLWAGKELIKSNYPKWKNEIEILKNVGHNYENVIHYHSFDESEVAITLFMELCDSNVEEYVRNDEIVPATLYDKNNKVEPKDYFNISPIEICKQAVCGIKYLHSTWNIVHRDIKPSNFLLVRTSDGTVVKVSDFGLSKLIPPGKMSVFTGSMGTKIYMARECYDKTWNRPTDVFALGVLLYFVLSNGHFPFGEEDYRQETNIRESQPPKLDYLRGWDMPFSEEQKITACDLIKRMISHIPQDRLTVNDVLCHPTFWNSKKKVEFYKKIHVHLKPKINQKLDDLNRYDGGLLKDEDAEKLVDFDIRLSNVPKPIQEQKNYPVKSCSNVQALVRLIRNHEAHACDKNQTKKIKRCLGATGDRLDMDKFLEALTGNYPQLLVHLYEYYRGKNVAREFYKSENATKDSSLQPTIKPFDVPTTSSGVIKTPLSPWEQFLADRGIPATSFYEYVITVKYNGATIKQKKCRIENSLKLYYSTEQRSDATASEITFPAHGDLQIKEILNHYTDGVILRTDPKTKSLFALRKCAVQLFFSCHLQQVARKMERETETEVLSFENLVEQFQKGCLDVKKTKVEFVFGKDPNTRKNKIYPVSASIESSAVALLISQHALNSEEPTSTSILISLES